MLLRAYLNKVASNLLARGAVALTLTLYRNIENLDLNKK
jgi:hypothetical protein